MKLSIIPLGGVGEIGKNLTVLAIGEHAIVIDAGLSFPTPDLPGIDYVIPDFSYLKLLKVYAVLVTHGHEDHIGGIPYLLQAVAPQKPAFFGSEVTMRFVARRLADHDLRANLQVIQPGQWQNASCFRFMPFMQNHSIPGAYGFVIDTPVGRIVHSGDFKAWPERERAKEWDVLRQAAQEGVRLLLADSTNAMEPGYARSEADVEPGLRRAFETAKGRIVAATFASSIFRIETLLRLAGEYNRRVAFMGRSMLKSLEIIRESKMVEQQLLDNVIEFRDAERVPDERLLIIATGAQGEPMSGLWRMAKGLSRDTKLRPGDMVIISATPIPGNDRMVAEIIDDLYRLGVEVIAGSEVHASGHGNQEDLRTLLRVVKPESFIPVHGEYRMLVHHTWIAQEQGVPKERTLILDNGHRAILTARELKLGEPVHAGEIYVENGVEDYVPQGILNDRIKLQDSGVAIIAFSFNPRTLEVSDRPRIRLRGVVDYRKYRNWLNDLERMLLHQIQKIKAQTQRDLERHMENVVERAFRERFQSQPIVIAIGMKNGTKETEKARYSA